MTMRFLIFIEPMLMGLKSFFNPVITGRSFWRNAAY